MSSRDHTRRDFLKAMGLGAAALAAPGCTGSPQLEAKNYRRPNIVLIMADDMGYSDIGCYGGEINTPNLNGLAAKGVRFTQFYNTARCCPTRAALMTGLYQHQAGVGHMTGDYGYDAYRGDLNNNCVTIAEVLKQAGYSTYMSGKWHVTKYIKPEGPKHNWPRQRGFDRFFGTIHGAGSFYDPNSLTRDNTQIVPEDGFYYTNAISDNAVKFIGEHRSRSGDKPFFLYVPYTAPHWPMHALPEDIAKYKGRYDGGWDALRAERHRRMIKMGLVRKDWEITPRDEGVPSWADAKDKEWFARRMEVYAAMVDNLDQGVGRIIAELKKTGDFENTLIFFLADNGGCAEEYGSRGAVKPDPAKPVVLKPMGEDELQTRMQPSHTRDGRPVRTGYGVMPGPADTYIAYGKAWANASNTPFRRYKHWVHEGGISTPLIAHWPARIRSRGKLRHQPGHLIDIMATCVDVSLAEYPSEYKGNSITPMEGRSLVPAFDSKPIEREAIYWEHEGNRAVRQGKWKLVSRHPGEWELYDLEADRTELNDLAQKHPAKLAELKSLYESWAERCGVRPWPARKPARKKKAAKK
ncbi:MAG: arylsulfatase [Planctomycetota bacterium]